MTEPTPSPWLIDLNSRTGPPWMTPILDSNGILIAHVVDGNTSLVAATPDMLAALKRMYRDMARLKFGDERDQLLWEGFSQMGDAIRKAESNPPAKATARWDEPGNLITVANSSGNPEEPDGIWLGGTWLTLGNLIAAAPDLYNACSMAQGETWDIGAEVSLGRALAKAEDAMAERTPGPWKVDRVEDQMGDLGVLDQHDEWVATCLAVNADLIAAAPEMLEALKVATTDDWDPMLISADDIRNVMLAAIRKAEGRDA